MTLAQTDATGSAVAAPSHRAETTARARFRDPRLDFFRGIAMFIILIAHVPGNWWTLWIPARWGYSDATEIFVFCSGMASAIAFGRVFRDRSWFLGTARVLFRCWQVYWAHIGLFLAVAALTATLNATGLFARDYVGQLNLYPFFERTEATLVALLTLTYVPNYFDILPMYLVILAMMPAVVWLAARDLRLAAGGVVAVWLLAQLQVLAFPAEPWSDREWFFNPFGWQLIFFTGFAFMAGWLPPPPRRVALIWLAVAFLVLTSPLSSPRVVSMLKDVWPAAADWSMAIYPQLQPLAWKTDFGILRYAHFLALAYLAWIAVGPLGARLSPPEGDGALARLWRSGLAAIMKVGQQSLAIFITSMFLARVLGVAIDVMGRNHLTMLVVNCCGAAILVGMAYFVAWFKSQPWRTPKT